MPAMLLDHSPDWVIPAIRIHTESASQIAVRYLVALGRRRIALFLTKGAATLDVDVTSRGERYRGYRRALAEAGLHFDPTLVVQAVERSS